MKLDLTDLKPQTAKFTLSEHPDVVFELKKFDLNARIWLHNKFKQDEIKAFFANQSMPEISEVVFYLLKNKELIPTLYDLRASVVTQTDIAAIFQALLTTIGISEPVVDKLMKEAHAGNAQSLNQLIGAESMTSSQPSTDIPLSSS